MRHRVKLVTDLLQDDEALRAERRKAKKEGREKYQGYSKDDMRHGISSSGIVIAIKNIICLSLGSTRMGDIDRWKGNDRQFDDQRKTSNDDDGYRLVFYTNIM